jgi:hypothetical protein
MILNSTKKKSKGWMTPVLVLVLIGTIGTAVQASGTSIAHISPGESTAEGSRVQASGTSGKLVAESSGPTYSVDGIATRYNGIWPDPTMARVVAGPGKGPVSATFKATSGSKYYAEAYTQYRTTSIYAEAKVTVN